MQRDQKRFAIYLLYPLLKASVYPNFRAFQLRNLNTFW